LPGGPEEEAEDLKEPLQDDLSERLTALAHTHGLVGIDGLLESAGPPPPAADLPPLTLSEPAARRIRDEIARAGGREVCFLARVDEARRVVDARAVARGNQGAVLAVARD